MVKKDLKIEVNTILEVNTPEVLAEVIEQELVVIHLGHGYYYHGNDTGSQIWTLIGHNYTVGEMSTYLSNLYDTDSSKMQKTVREYLRILSGEGLIRKTGKKSLKKLAVPLIKLPKFVTPTLKKHEDMKELLLLDPIHDVGEKTWDMSQVK